MNISQDTKGKQKRNAIKAKKEDISVEYKLLQGTSITNKSESSKNSSR